jgi:hypothetical protein
LAKWIFAALREGRPTPAHLAIKYPPGTIVKAKVAVHTTACVLRVTGQKESAPLARQKPGFTEGNKRPHNGDNSRKWCPRSCVWEIVMVSRKSALLMAVIGGSLTSLHAHAQWWSRAPADFEQCADIAEKAASKEARTSALVECNAKFAGRRKPSGGYTYFDFMQNRSFDIAGPNPTPQEQKHIDEQYTVYLDRQPRSTVALAVKEQQSEPQRLSLENEKVPVPVEAPNKPRAAAGDLRSRSKGANCAQHSFSCDWPRLSEGLKDLKKALFGPPSRNPEIASRKRG